MSKVRFKLRLVQSHRPLGSLTIAEKRAKAIAWLRERGKYIMDRGTPTPQWGHGMDKLEKSK